MGPIYIEEKFKDRQPGIANLSACSHYVLGIPLLERNGETHILFEVRGAISQAGDVCLPGGRAEAGEALTDALLREMTEELLCDRDQIKIIGASDIFLADTKRALHPYLVRLRDYRGTFSGNEVAEVFTLPLRWFLTHRPKTYTVQLREVPGEDFPFDKIAGGRNYRWLPKSREISFYECEGRVIWGLTAAILRRFAELAQGEDIN